jgi:hypothetical protein
MFMGIYKLLIAVYLVCIWSGNRLLLAKRACQGYVYV